MGYYKNYLWFECAMILFDHIMVTADSSNFKFPKDKLPDGADPAIAQMVVMVLFAFSLAIEMLLFAQSVSLIIKQVLVY
jgi:hypothetical protein